METEKPHVSLMFDVFRLASRFDALMRGASGEEGVTLGEFGVLSLLARSGPQRPTEVASILGSPKSSLTAPLRNLESKGLLTRRAVDGRSDILELTGDGAAVHGRIVDRIFARWDWQRDSPVDNDRFRSDLVALVAVLDERLAASPETP